MYAVADNTQSANGLTRGKITCLYDMDIPKPDNFNECYLYEGIICLTLKRSLL